MEKQKDFWNLIKPLRRSDEAPWVVIGDFNEILSQ